MKGDSLELAKMISDVHVDLKEKFGDLQAEVANLRGTFSTDIEGTKLRVKSLEDENVREAWKTWAGRVTFGGVIFRADKTTYFGACEESLDLEDRYPESIMGTSKLRRRD